VPHVEQGLLTLPGHMSPPPGFSGVPVARSLVVCVMFCTSAFVFSSFGHCVVCPIMIRGFVLPLCYLVAIVLPVLLRFTLSYYLFGILWPLCCLSYYDSRFRITSLVFCGHFVFCPIAIHVLYYVFGILWPLCCLSYYDSRFVLPLWYLVVIVLSVLLRFMFCFTSLVSCDRCVVCPITIHGFVLRLWCLQAFLECMLSIDLVCNFDA
jgi:hypothetical protein